MYTFGPVGTKNSSLGYHIMHGVGVIQLSFAEPSHEKQSVLLIFLLIKKLEFGR